MKRQIRLREHKPNSVIYKYPAPQYVESRRHLDNNTAYRLQTDHDGFIVSGRCFSQKRSICLIGDSFIENLYVHEDARWNNYLERLFLQSGMLFKVFNAGYSGATSLNVLNTIINKIVNQKFDVLIYVISSNDFSGTCYEKTYWNLSKNHSNFILESYVNEARDYQNPCVESFNAIVRSIYNIAEVFGQKFYFATYPNMSNSRALRFLNGGLRTMCKDENYELLDIDEMMSGIDFEANFHDDLHLNASGSACFSEKLYNFIAEKYGDENNFVKFSDSTIYSTKFKLQELNGLSLKDISFGGMYPHPAHIGLIFDVADMKLTGENDIIVRLVFEEPASVRDVENLLYSDSQGYHFFLTGLANKAIQVSHNFTLACSGAVDLELSCLSSDSYAIIEKIRLEKTLSN